MNTKKYIVSSFLLAALVLSFGTQVSAQGVDATVKLNADAAVKIAPAPLSKACSRIDMDANGKLNAQDFPVYAKIYDSNDVAKADMDASGSLTPNDFIAYQNTFASCTYVRGIDKVPTKTGSTQNDPASSAGSETVPTTPTATGGIKPIKGNVSGEKVNPTDARNLYKMRFSQLEALLNKLTKLADVIERRINELASQSVNVSEAKAHLSSARLHLSYARNAIDSAMKMYTNYGTGTVQETVKIAKTELGEARKDLIAAVKALRMHDKNSAGNDKTLAGECKRFDMNADAKLTSADHISFQTAYDKGEKSADADLSGSLTANDFQAFMNGYARCTS